ncbi:MAG: D-allulose 6-phosphate 3-epimerase [Pygmaiobacter sp.]
MKPFMNPSLMCMDFLSIREQISILNKRADFYHIDIMDGHFVPNITLSPDFVRAIAPISELPLDIHLMCTDPAQYLEMLTEAVEPLTRRGIKSYFSPHAEVMNGKGFRLLDAIQQAGFCVGVAINPETPLCDVMAYLHRLDKITFMSVDPGFSGQPFIPEVLDKVREAKALKNSDPQRYHFIIEIDGSCNKRTYQTLADAGIESFIVGSSGLFGNDPDLSKAWDIMESEIAGSLHE